MYERIGNLIETPGLYPNMSAGENLKCKCLALGIYKKGFPNRETSPDVGVARPHSIFMQVVLPAPFLPINP